MAGALILLPPIHVLSATTTLDNPKTIFNGFMNHILFVGDDLHVRLIRGFRILRDVIFDKARATKVQQNFKLAGGYAYLRTSFASSETLGLLMPTLRPRT